MKRVQRALLTSTIVLALGAGAATYTWFEGYEKNRQIESENEQNKRLFKFGRIHLERLELKNKQGLVIFEKDKNRDWQIISPVAWHADQDVVRQLADLMVSIKAHVTVTDDATDQQLKEYGLDQPAITLAVTLKSGEQHELRVGHKHNFENGYYISDKNQKRIGIASAHFHDTFSRDLTSFRAQQVLPYRPESFAAVRVSKNSNLLYDLTKEEGKWKIQNRPADHDFMSRFLLLLTRDLKSESYETDKFDKIDPAQLKSYGFSPPLFEMSVTINEGPKYRIWISQDKEALGGRGPFAHIIGTQTVVSIYENFLHDIDKPALKFKDRSISRFDQKKVHKIKFRYPSGKTSEVVKKGEEWHFTKRSDLKAKPWRIEALIMRFSHLNSDEIVTDKPTADEKARWQLNTPIHQVSFFDEEDTVLGDVQIGKRQDETNVFITAGGQSRVDVIAADKLAGFPNSDASLAAD